MEDGSKLTNTFNEAAGSNEKPEISGADEKAKWPDHPMAKSEVFTHVTSDGYQNKAEDFLATGRFMGRVEKNEQLEDLLKFEAGRKREHEKENENYSYQMKNILAKTPGERARAEKSIERNHELAKRDILDKYSGQAKDYYKENMGIAKDFNARSKEHKDIDMGR